MLGFVHEDTPKEVDGREVRRWGLTREGVEYLRLHEAGDHETARERLVGAIRGVEIVRRVHAELEDRGELSYDDLRETVAAETTLAESSVARRSSTVAQWLATLPEVEMRRDGRSKKLVRA